MDQMVAGRVRRLLKTQEGVVSRRQMHDLGGTDADVRRLLRRREWAPLHPGVYVNHTGAPSWRQRAWGAVLFAEPAALGGRSALVAAGVRLDQRDPHPIEITVPRHRAVRPPPGIVVRRSDGTWGRAALQASPPRSSLEDAALDAAAASRRDLDAVAVLAGVVASRRTTVGRLLDTLALRPQLTRHALMSGVLGDVAQGVHSALEHEYLVRVERPHGLPRSERQLNEQGVYRDVVYVAYNQVVELDGVLVHGSVMARDADLDRDLDRAIAGRDGVRLGWGQVVDRPCRTAVRIGALLQQRGWDGECRRNRCCA